MMLGSLFTALRKAGADDDVAQRASEEVASAFLGLDGRFDKIDTRIRSVETLLSELTSKVSVLTWAVTANTALLVVVLGILLRDGR